MVTNLTNFTSKAEAQTSFIHGALETCSRRELLGSTWTQSSSCHVAHVPHILPKRDGWALCGWPQGLKWDQSREFLRQADSSKTCDNMSRLPCCSVLLSEGLEVEREVQGPWFLVLTTHSTWANHLICLEIWFTIYKMRLTVSLLIIPNRCYEDRVRL